MAVRYHHGNLREVLIAEGAKLIEEKGVSGLTLRDIGERAGVSRTAPYRHFADKSELLDAISEAGFTDFADALEAARDSNAKERFGVRLHAMGVAYLRFAEERRAYYQVMFMERCTPGGPAADRAFGVIEGMIRSGQTSGDVRPGDAAVLAKVVWALVHGLATLRLNLDFKIVSDILRTGL
ncbi:MAG TPA: TetR/AcrR family transcriptional regulator [Bryobacteraceae bacterium]|nr:TetR/AcrR family transcriptional regulator [Bryobacteraceae bacterium]